MQKEYMNDKLHVIYEESGEISPEAFEKLKPKSDRVLSKAEKAGHSQKTVQLIHQAALEYSQKTELPYDACYDQILSMMGSDEGSRINLNAKLDKYSQPFRPGPDQAKNQKDAGTIMKAQDRNKSSKGKHPSNFTPPKKKRK